MIPIIQKPHFEFRYKDGRSKNNIKDRWLGTHTRRTPPGSQNMPSWAGALSPRESTVIAVGGHKMHIFTFNIPTFHSRYRR
jgi:hypothetical protein